jgi:predicted RNase H-like nuclease (RuvC/YqgF family)
MLSDFIHDIKVDIEKQISLLDQTIHMLQDQIKEDEKFLEILLEDSDAVFTEFSPRDLNNKKEQEIRDLEMKIREEQDELTEENERLEKLQKKLAQVESISEESISLDQDINREQVINGLEVIDSYILSDPRRAKMELHRLVTKLKKVENDK